MSMTTTTTNGEATTAPPATAPAAGYEKGWTDLFGSLVPSLVRPIAESVGIDPRVAGQAASQVLSIFGIGGVGKDFTPAVPKQQIVTQLQEVVAPCLGNPAEVRALKAWLTTALEPVQAYQGGKAFQPDFEKSWLSDAWDSVTDTVGDAVSAVGGAVSSAASSIDWDKVGQIGLRALPLVIAAL
jgi:hypothetical protein